MNLETSDKGPSRHHGNLFDILEPGVGAVSLMLDNDTFPPDWFAQTSACDHRCHACDYCDQLIPA
jgi:hypothetical protein